MHNIFAPFKENYKGVVIAAGTIGWGVLLKTIHIEGEIYKNV